MRYKVKQVLKLHTIQVVNFISTIIYLRDDLPLITRREHLARLAQVIQIFQDFLLIVRGVKLNFERFATKNG